MRIHPFQGKQVLVILLLAFLHFQPTYAKDKTLNEKETLKMGVFPIVSGVALFKRFAPLKDHIAKKTWARIDA